MRKFVLGALVLLCCGTLFGQTSDTASQPQVVPGWYKTGVDPKGIYQVTADRNHVHGGKSSISIRCETCSTAPSPDDATDFNTPHGVLGQTINADTYRNKRVRFAAYLQTQDVRGDGAILWLTVTGDNGRPVAIDNMTEPDRSVHGTTEWRKYDIVLDVPQTAASISYGAILSGRGQLWVDDASFEVVSGDTPITGDPTKYRKQVDDQMAKLTPEDRAEMDAYLKQWREKQKQHPLPDKPQNLGFEQ